MAETRLEMAERHVAQQEECVTRQEELIGRLRRHKVPIGPALLVLEEMLGILNEMQRNVARLKAE